MELSVCYNVHYYNPTFGTTIVENGEFYEIMVVSQCVCEPSGVTVEACI